MPTQAFIKQKKIGRWFEGLMRPELEQMGFEVIDSDKQKYQIKKGYDCILRIKNSDGIYRRNDRGQIIQDRAEFKYDEMSEQTGNVCIDLDSIQKSISAWWFFGLKEGNQIEVYLTEILSLAPFAQSWPVKKRVGENGWVEAAIVPKSVFKSQQFIKHFKTIPINNRFAANKVAA